MTGKKIKKNAVASKKVKDHSLLGKDFKSGQLPAGAKGDKGDKADPGTSVFASSLPSGQTVKGVWGGRFATPTANTYSFNPRVGFPVAAPVGPGRRTGQLPSGHGTHRSWRPRSDLHRERRTSRRRRPGRCASTSMP